MASKNKTQKTEPVFGFIEQDTRIVDLRLRRHVISRAEHQKSLLTLPDEAKNAVQVQMTHDQETTG